VRAIRCDNENNKVAMTSNKAIRQNNKVKTTTKTTMLKEKTTKNFN